MPKMYVVFSQTEGQADDLKVFSMRADASGYAANHVENGADTADVYEIADAKNAPAAKAALQMGEGHFVEAHGREATPDEIKAGAYAALMELLNA